MHPRFYVRAVAFALIVAGAIAGFFALGELLESAPWELRLVLAVALLAGLAVWAGRPSPGEPGRDDRD